MNSKELGEELSRISEKFNEERASYRDMVNRTEVSKDSLLEYQGRFTDLKGDVRLIHAEVAKYYAMHDDKSATAIKYRIAYAIVSGEFKDEEGRLIYDKCSLSQAEKLAAGSDKYKTFVSQRCFWKESLVNISDLRDDISSYIIEISNRLKK